MATAQLTLVQRRECELCEQMRRELDLLATQVALPVLEIVDVDADPTLQRRHGLDVPVLLVDGAVACRHRLDRAELLRLLRAR